MTFWICPRCHTSNHREAPCVGCGHADPRWWGMSERDPIWKCTECGKTGKSPSGKSSHENFLGHDVDWWRPDDWEPPEGDAA